MRLTLIAFMSCLVLAGLPTSTRARVMARGCSLRPSPVITGERSSFTTQHGPDHAFFSIRNPGRTPMHFELSGLFELAPVRATLTVERIELEPGGEVTGLVFDVAPRRTARVTVFFETLGPGSQFEIGATFRREGCPFTATARVSAATRHPMH